MAPAVQGDQIAGCTPQEAHLAVEANWPDSRPELVRPAWLGLSSISSRNPATRAGRKGLGDVSVMAADITIDKLGARMSAEDAKPSEPQWFRDVVAAGRAETVSLMHGDYRLDNMLFDPDRTSITVVDWQTMGVGLPARDLAYFTATSLAPEVRSEIEQDLVGRYHEACRPTVSPTMTPKPVGATTVLAHPGAVDQRTRIRLRRINRTRRRDDADHVPPWLPGDPGTGHAHLINS